MLNISRVLLNKMNNTNNLFRDYCKKYSYCQSIILKTRNVSSSSRDKICNIFENRLILSFWGSNQQTQPFRTKYSSKSDKSKNNEDSDSDQSDEEYKDERDSKVIKSRVNSLRTDLIIKSGLGLARNKVETIFYESKVRVNGTKIPKKSSLLRIGDEVDVIKGFSPVNPLHLVVSKIVILDAKVSGENILVSLRRYKTLIIENYEGHDHFK